MAKLITGGTGYIGAELAYLLISRGQEVVLFDININRYHVSDIESKVKVVQGDLSSFSEVLNAVKYNNITEIYHLGAMLTFESELNPWASFRTNVIGTYNVLEAARLFGVKQIMFASSIGTFGIITDEVVTDSTLQRPTTIYGCGKLYGEGIGNFYRNKFGLDFRSTRYAHVIGPNIHTPGHWVPPIIENAILGKSHECIYGTPESTISMIYFRDAARAAEMILEAPRENIKTVNYNTTGIPNVVSTKTIETILKKRFPETKIIYNDLPDLQEPTRRLASMKVFDDSNARKEWGWKPRYTTPEEIIDAFEKDMKKYSERRD